MELEVRTLSKPGGRDSNEDTCGEALDAARGIFILCDGAGGHHGGAVASKLAVETALAALQRNPLSDAVAIEQGLRAANLAIVAVQARDDALHAMRTTIVALVIDCLAQTAQWGHLGDSRLYFFHSKRIASQTRDHSVVQAMIDSGYLRQDEIRTAPNRNVLSGALGDADNFQPSIQPQAVAIESGDAFLLCSDGFWEYVLEDEMELALSRVGSAAEWLNAMEKLVTQRGRARQDNYSAIAIWCGDANEVTDWR